MDGSRIITARSGASTACALRYPTYSNNLAGGMTEDEILHDLPYLT